MGLWGILAYVLLQMGGAYGAEKISSAMNELLKRVLKNAS